MKKSNLVVLLFIVAAQAFGQHLKYKELFPMMSSMTNEELRNSLKEFLADDRDHPNANFRLALVYEKNYLNADPLTEYANVLANANQAKLYFLKAKQLVDEREVNKNNEYYFPIFKIADSKGKPNVPFTVVSTKLKNGYDSADLFSKKLPPIYTAFTSSVNYYDKAVKIFADINSRFLSMDDLYLYFDNDLDKQLEELRLAYDSAKSSFDKYLLLTKSYPIQRHKQSYGVKPIVTYRMDGLTTSINFLTDKILFWDYDSWVTDVRKALGTSIAALRNDLNQAEEKLDQSLMQIQQSASVSDLKPVKLDKHLIFTLNNYDKQSLALALLEYKSYKQPWLIQAKSITPDTTFSDRNAEVYSSLIYTARNADTLANSVNERITEAKIGKHKDFLLKYYGNKDGIQRYISAEKNEIDKSFKEYTSHLQSEVIGLALKNTSVKEENKFIRLGKWNISQIPVVPTKELLNKGEPLTIVNKKSPDGSIYLSGMYKADKKSKFVYSFIAKINPDGKTGWMKNFEYKNDSLSKVPDANNYVTTFELTKEGCAALVRTEDTLKIRQLNLMVYFNDKGEEKIKVKLKENGYPRKLNYIEKTNSFILVLKGREAKNDYSISEPLVTLNINAIGDVIWIRKIEVAGSFNDIINLSDGNLLVGNFMILKDVSGKEFRTQVSKNETNPFIILFNGQGDIVKVQPIQTVGSTLILKTLKVNDMSINLLG
ncbi:MAG TPA: hypothetical protein DGG95_05195, partial [Cytophagales bacterium]|nr:hypothetical protein [Cytophagales bacterium]